MRYIRVITALFTITAAPAFAQHQISTAAPPVDPTPVQRKANACDVLWARDRGDLFTQLQKTMDQNEEMDALKADKTKALASVDEMTKAAASENEQIKILENKLGDANRVIALKDKEITDKAEQALQRGKDLDTLRATLRAQQEKAGPVMHHPTSPELR